MTTDLGFAFMGEDVVISDVPGHEKFVKTMEEARELAIQSLREEFAGMVERITERFSTGPDGKAKVFKNATVNGFYEFFETFRERNIFRDEHMRQFTPIMGTFLEC